MEHNAIGQGHVLVTGMDEVKRCSISCDLCLRPILWSGLVFDQRSDPRGRGEDSLDRIGCLGALNPRHGKESLERLGLLGAKHRRTSTMLIKSSKRVK
jgi:hypothetical protein